MSERTYEVRIDVTASELQILLELSKKNRETLGGIPKHSSVDRLVKNVVIAHAEQNLSAEKEAEIKAALGVEE